MAEYDPSDPSALNFDTEKDVNWQEKFQILKNLYQLSLKRREELVEIIDKKNEKITALEAQLKDITTLKPKL